jgi:DNA-binding transcriptional regulator YbjK
MKMSIAGPPLPKQDRSRRRREALLRAAAEVLADGGPKAVTHRAVAQRAGVPTASATYHFESVQSLTEEALRLQVAERVDELEGLTAAAMEGGRSAEEVAQLFAASLAGRSHVAAIAQYELYIEAARNPALRAPVAEAIAAFEGLAEAVLRVLGARRPAQGAAVLVALLDGFLLHRIALKPDPADEAAVLFEAMRALFIAQVMDDEELERWYARFRAAPPAAPG